MQCSAATNHLITNAVFNISSDIMIILLPMPVFLQSQLPTKKKVILCLIFALGAFTVSFFFKPAGTYERISVCTGPSNTSANQIKYFVDPLGDPEQVLQFREAV